jgi:hypothetical protein
VRNKIELIIGIILLGLLILLFVWSNQLMNSTTEELSELGVQAVEAANRGDWEETCKIMEAYNQTWHDKKSKIALIMEHSYIRAIDETIENATTSCWLNDYNHFIRNIEGAKHSLKHAVEVEALDWSTLF